MNVIIKYNEFIPTRLLITKTGTYKTNNAATVRGLVHHT